MKSSALLFSSTLCAALVLTTTPLPSKAATPPGEWPTYLGGADRNHYSPLTQIHVGNVARLQQAWEYHTGEYGEMQCNPLIVDGTAFGVTATNQVFALSAGTGKELWRFREESGEANKTLGGVAYWKSGDDRRILFSLGSMLCALDATTGRPVPSFGLQGKTSLKQGLGGAATDKWVISTTPGTVFRDLIIVPTRVNEEPGAAPGFVQAFDIRTGKLAWVFHTIPHPGENGFETWPPNAHQDVRVGGANSWAGMSLDEERGILFVPTGSAAPDFWGGYRKGQNLYANCLLALDAATGKLLWHYQFVHHDIWDRDLPAPPNLVTVQRDGKAVPAVAQVTKAGYVFLFHRTTGAPLFPIEEVAVPASDLAGEEAWPTQPRPIKPAPYARQSLSENDLSPYAPNREELLARFRQARTGWFLPFSKTPTVLLPGFDGGAEWGGAAATPDGVLYVNATEMAWMAELVDTPTEAELAHLSPGHRLFMLYCTACHGAERQGNPTNNVPSLRDIAARRTPAEIVELISKGKAMMPGFPGLAAEERQALAAFLCDQERPGATVSAPTLHAEPRTPYKLNGYNKFLDAAGYPAIAPPWGTLSAIDLNTGEYRWKITLGEFKELSARGIPPTGAENYGGPVVTASGVLFIAATKDGQFRAFDAQNGAQLWQTELPAPGFATPATYEVDGKQYVLVACGGTKLGTKKGDSYVAFALP